MKNHLLIAAAFFLSACSPSFADRLAATDASLAPLELRMAQVEQRIAHFDDQISDAEAERRRARGQLTWVKVMTDKMDGLYAARAQTIAVAAAVNEEMSVLYDQKYALASERLSCAPIFIIRPCT